MFGSRSKLCCAIAVVGVLSGCGGSDPPPPSSGQQPGSDACKGATEYSAGLEAAGDKGLITVTLVDSNPAPPGVGNNDWSIDVKDASGNALTGAKVLFDLYMPLHRHHSPKNPIISDAGNGTYDAKGVDFNMDGLWQITVQVTSSDASITDSAMFTLCAQ